jgi:predicted RNase H-like nuclease
LTTRCDTCLPSGIDQRPRARRGHVSSAKPERGIYPAGTRESRSALDQTKRLGISRASCGLKSAFRGALRCLLPSETDQRPGARRGHVFSAKPERGIYPAGTRGSRGALDRTRRLGISRASCGLKSAFRGALRCLLPSETDQRPGARRGHVLSAKPERGIHPAGTRESRSASDQTERFETFRASCGLKSAFRGGRGVTFRRCCCRRKVSGAAIDGGWRWKGEG